MTVQTYDDLALVAAQAAALYGRCPWRTVFAHPDFLGAWYGSRPDHAPLLLASADGLVPLARQGDRLCFAGDRDVPVHGWLAEPLRGSFVLERHLAEAPRLGTLSVSLPPEAPVDWLGEGRALGRIARSETAVRRSFELDPVRARQKLDDKKNTSQLPHLKALGPLALAEVQPEDLPTFVEWHRHKRHARGLQPSLHSERLGLYRRLPGSILSATVMTAGTTVLSALLIYRDGPRAWLELLAEHPEQERHSPGLLHLYLLEERWIGEVREIDVTRDDDYLHRIAGETSALQVDLSFGRRARIRRLAGDALRRFGVERR